MKFKEFMNFHKLMFGARTVQTMNTLCLLGDDIIKNNGTCAVGTMYVGTGGMSIKSSF